MLPDPHTYQWGSPIAHLISREHDGDTHQDACPQGAGGFSNDFDYWWIVVWPPKYSFGPSSSYLPANIVFGLAGAILAWEELPVDSHADKIYAGMSISGFLVESEYSSVCQLLSCTYVYMYITSN